MRSLARLKDKTARDKVLAAGCIALDVDPDLSHRLTLIDVIGHLDLIEGKGSRAYGFSTLTGKYRLARGPARSGQDEENPGGKARDPFWLNSQTWHGQTSYLSLDRIPVWSVEMRAAG
ncbi:MAG: hypothetical protein NVSMB9_06360 [Isosphaeraceae bacterium]